MNDVLLVNLPIQTHISQKLVGNYDFSPSIGLMYMQSFLTFNGFSCEIRDFAYDNISKNEFLQLISLYQPKVIGISAYTENISLAIKFSRIIKQYSPNILIVWGGVHVSLDLDEFISTESADFAIVNEGESSIVELMTAINSNETLLKYDDIEGLAFKRNGEFVKNQSRAYINDLDLLPLPSRDYFGLNRFSENKAIFVSTSRGCPNNCIYCSAQALSGKMYRVRNIDNVFLEILMLQNEIGKISINIVDDSFTIMRKRVERFLELIEEHHSDFRWICESIVKHMTEDLLVRMKNDNLLAIQYGMESGNQETLNKINKGIDLDYAMKIIDATHRLGIIPILSFIFGHYCETAESARDTINFMKKAVSEYDAQVVASFNTPFPGTYQYIHKDELGMTFISDDYRLYTLRNPIVETQNFSIDDQINWFYEVANIQNKKGAVLNERKD